MGCGLCGKKCSTRGNVKMHVLVVHLEEVDCGDIRKHIIPGQREFECEQCRKRFFKKESLEKHTRVHHMEKFECEYCRKKFLKKESLEKHTRVHHMEKLNRKFGCELC